MNVYVFVVFVMVTALSLSQKYKVIDIKSKGHTYLGNYGILFSDNQLVFELKGCSGSNIDFLDETGDWVFFAHFTNKHDFTSVLKLELFAKNFDKLFTIQLNHHSGCNTFFKLKLTWKNGKFALWNYQMSGWRLVDEGKYLPLDGIKDIRIFIGDTDTLQWKIYAVEHTTTPNNVHCINV